MSFIRTKNIAKSLQIGKDRPLNLGQEIIALGVFDLYEYPDGVIEWNMKINIFMKWDPINRVIFFKWCTSSQFYIKRNIDKFDVLDEIQKIQKECGINIKLCGKTANTDLDNSWEKVSMYV